MPNHWVLSVLLSAFISAQLRYSEAGSFGSFVGNSDSNGDEVLRQNIENARDNRHIYNGLAKDRVRQLLFPDAYQKSAWKLMAAGPRSLPQYGGISDSLEDTDGEGWAPFEAYGNVAADQLPSSAFWDESNNVMTKREGHSLSIVNPLDVLRQRLMLEMARRRMKENQEQIKANEAILKSLGKRNNGGANQTKVDRSEEFAARRGLTNRRRALRQDYDNTQDSGATDFEV